MNSTRNRKQEDRRSSRYPLEAFAILICNNDIIETTTVNMSSDGVLLKRPIPKEWLQKEITLQLSYENSEGKVFEVAGLCQAVDDSLERVKFQTNKNKFNEFIEKVFA